ncbi:unnamed protein product [Prorocentrum cordatum]|uniref:Uncharacterized protein n=1 Tax=Prorocentrum cordatum TaxID=2364126 RepID=A0ABN9UH84_9DINO|nr:unnamed protein product [Polarella glacialis]|mmetsp:Transcript_73077/g.190672  ORF Transcript_73077/g.190672 Transcript_73077/m.190672 type:complete len:131 (+) Transcript_73077:354-746(+)
MYLSMVLAQATRIITPAEQYIRRLCFIMLWVSGRCMPVYGLIMEELLMQKIVKFRVVIHHHISKGPLATLRLIMLRSSGQCVRLDGLVLKKPFMYSIINDCLPPGFSIYHRVNLRRAVTSSTGVPQRRRQ